MASDEPGNNDDERPQISSAKQWLSEHGLSEVAELIDEVEAEWASTGRKTRRNWWDVLAGHVDGGPRVVAGRTFPVIAEARRRQGLPPHTKSGERDEASPGSAASEREQPQDAEHASAPGLSRGTVGTAFRAAAARLQARAGIAGSDDAGRNVLITGVSSGIGKRTAALLTAQGFRVFGTSRSSHPDEAGIEMLQLDVCSDESIARCVAQLEARAGSIDIPINNAGVEHIGIAEETSLEQARAVFDTNFFGVVRVTNAALPKMRERRRGRIINVGSAAAWLGEPGEAFYSASKHALAAYSESLRHEVWPLGIHVSVIEPGALKTGILAAATGPEGIITDYDAVRAAAARTLQRSVRHGEAPEEIARLIVKVVRARSPRLRYAAGIDAIFLPYLKLLVPQRWFDRWLRRGVGSSQSQDQRAE